VALAGTGNRVRIPGWQNWLLSEEMLIVRADGGFDAKENKLTVLRLEDETGRVAHVVLRSKQKFDGSA